MYVNQPGLLQTIVADHWEAVKLRLERKLPTDVFAAATTAVEKMLR